jgi:hypothetical protein
MSKAVELKEKVLLLQDMVSPLLRYGEAVIGDKSIPILPFNKSSQWIGDVIETRPSIDRIAQKFGKLDDFKSLAEQVYGKGKKRMAKIILQELLLIARSLFNSMNTCYPITWDEPAIFVDTIDKVTSLTKKVVSILEDCYSKLNGDYIRMPEIEEIKHVYADSEIIAALSINLGPDAEGNIERKQYASSNQLNFEITTGLLNAPVKMDALTCALYSKDFCEDGHLGSVAKGDVMKSKKVKSPRKTLPPPDNFHLKYWVIDEYWPILEKWLINDWYYKGKPLCLEGLELNPKFRAGAPASLLVKLKEEGMIIKCGRTRGYTAKQAIQIIKETFKIDCSIDTYNAYHYEKPGITPFLALIPEMHIKPIPK